MNSVPPADSSDPAPATQKGPRPHRLRRNLLIALAVVVAIYIVFMVVAITTDVVFKNELLSADFRKGSEPFLTDSNADYTYGIVDATYQIKTKIADQGPASSLAFFNRTAYAVNMSADVESVSGDGLFGVGCYSGEDELKGGYLLLAHTDGGVVLLKTVPPDEVELIAENEEAAVPTNNVRIMLSCTNPVLTGSSVPLAGYINGEEVIRATDEDGLDGFTVGGLEFLGQTSGAEVRFTRADAVVSDKD